MRWLLLCFTALTKSLLVLRPSGLATDSAVLWWKPVPHCRFLFISHFFGLAEAGIRNSVRLDLIIHFSPESASEPARSRFSFFSNAVVRCRLFLLSWQVERPSWRSRASCFSAKHHLGSESSALPSPSPACFCCANSNRFPVHFVRTCIPRYAIRCVSPTMSRPPEKS